jgi:two-component system chemotaxis sensor kinase CheA
MEFDEEIREFLIESSDNLAILDRDILRLEQTPEDVELISSAFRTIHTIKGTCGFFGFDILSAVTHITENILSQVRERKRKLTPELISLILETVDEVKRTLGKIESTGSEGQDTTGPLRARLEVAHAACYSSQAVLMNSAVVAEPSRITVSDAPRISPMGSTSDTFTLPLTQPEINQEDLLVLSVAVAEAPEMNGPKVDILDPANARGLNVEVLARETVVLPDGAPVDDVVQESSKETIREAQLADTSIRVDVSLLNRLMNLVGELVLARNQLLQDSSSQNASLQKTAQRLNLITSELQEGVMKTRMQPIGVVWNKLPRVVRDLASKCGKRVQIEMEGAGTELDKTIIEAIKDPLTHIVRNSCDHGIETPDVRIAAGKSPEGTLLLRAYHEGGVVNIEITDDGAGIDPDRIKAKAIEKGLISLDQAAQLSVRDAIQLIFLPGFSTAAQINSISGRGVGMDVVKTNIEKIGGSVEMGNRPKSGTTLRIKIPLTLAIIPGLVVTLDREDVVNSEDGPRWSKEERFIIPQANLLELVRLEGLEVTKRIENVHGTAVFHHRGKLLPLVYLGRVLGRSASFEPKDIVNIVVLQAENRQLGVVVDRICDTQEIVVKPLGRQLKGLNCYVGATIMGDGRPALILDVAGLSRLAGLGTQARPLAPSAQQFSDTLAEPQMMLLFRVGNYERMAVPLSLVDRLEEISSTRIEKSGGRSVLYYRGDILPLASLGSAASPEEIPRETTQIIVFSNGIRRVGLIVDQVLDIINESVTVRRNSSAPNLLGSALIGGKITDLIDLHAIVQSTGDNWLDPMNDRSRLLPRLLLVDPCDVAREMIGGLLEVSGYEVFQAATLVEASSKNKQRPFDLLMVANGLSEVDKSQLHATMQLNGGSHVQVRLIELLDRADQISTLGALASAQVVRSERSILLKTLSTLLQSQDSGKEASHESYIQ